MRNRPLPWPSLILALLCLAPALRAGTLVPIDSNWRWLRGTSEASSPDATAWRQVGFDASGWAEAPEPFWYGDVQPSPGTQLTDMRYNYTCIFMRSEFVLANPASAGDLTLLAGSDDGFIAWLNGHPVLSFNMPTGDIPYYGTASGALGETQPWPPTESYPLTDARSYLRAGTNVLAIQAFNNSLGDSSDFTINVGLESTVDLVAPTLTRVIPTATATVRSLREIEVDFDEAVTGVDAADLRVNGVPTTNLVVFSPSVYVFQFPQPATGTVQVAWQTGHGITDLAPAPNAFAGGSWTYTLDTNLPAPGVIISEFMASNDETLNDVDGDPSDWIELRNTDATSANLNGWFLTDSIDELQKWRIPNVTLAPNGYLVVFASGKNRTNPAVQLHTDFKLSQQSGYLALVNAEGQVVSAFAPGYPAQQTDVSYGRDQTSPTLLGYFTTPTPGAANSTGGPGFAPPVGFTRPGGTFLSTFQLALSTTSANATIRYTTDGTVPTASSGLYTTPITIATTTLVRARAFETGLLPGPVQSEGYVLLASSLANFTSDLPLLVLHSFGGGTVPANYDQPAYLSLFEPGATGRSSLTNAPTLTTRVGFNIRGRSTAGMAKASYAVELWDESNLDKDLSLLDMPSESDWVLYAPNMFDHPLIHNPFIYNLSRDLGRYAPRARLVELWVNTAGGAITGPVPSGDYRGVYVLLEKIKRNDRRVDLARLEPEHTQAPQVTGGYLMKVGDDMDSNERSFYAGQLNIAYQYPDGLEMVTAQRSAQATYLQNYFNSFYAALSGADPDNPVTGYAAYADPDAWIDHHLLAVLALNVDALRLSAYFFKDRDKRIEMGPIWDFDRSMGTSGGGDTRPFNPRNWRGQTWDEGTDFFNSAGVFSNPWYSLLFQRLDFWQRYIDRYQELRTTWFSNAYIHSQVDKLAAQLREAQPREVARWGDTTPRSGVVSYNGYSYTFPGTYQGEIDFMKHWLDDRLDFMDTNFLARPVPSRPAGPVAAGTTVTLTGPAGATLYYTLNGTDPRAAGGGLAARALTYSGPITINSNARLVARARNLNHANVTGISAPPLSTPWSGAVSASYIVQTPAVVITEIMYHPTAPPPGDSALEDEAFEYVEFLNRGTSTLNLNGFKVRQGIDYTFGNVVLAAGQRVLLAKDVAAFQSRYGTSLLVAGPYTGQLNNAGNRLVLTGPLGEPIHDFTYNNSWYPITDGQGFALAVADETGALTNWNTAAGWRPDGTRLGTPGQASTTLPTFPAVVINEALTHTDLPQVDSIELFNPGPGAADVGGWFLTDSFENPRKFVIPTPTSIPAGGFVVFDETAFNSGAAGSFRISSLGDDLSLFSADASGNLSGYVSTVQFGAAQNGVSFGRHTTSAGAVHFVPQARLTLGATNSGPRIGPVVINELMYDPTPVFGTNNNTRDEFIELRNVTAQAVPLYDTNNAANTWHLRGGVDFTFPTNLVLAANAHLVLVSFDPVWQPGDLAAFRTAYGIGTNVQVLGPYSDKLDNSGESVRLLKPDPPQTIPGPEYGLVPYVLVDEVDYANAAPWPVGANATGKSIERIVSDTYGNDPIYWQLANPSPGSSSTVTNPDADDDGLPDVWETAHGLDPHSATGADGAQGDPDQDGMTNLQEYIAGTNPTDPLSYLKVDSISANGAAFRLRFRAVAGKSYSVLYRATATGAAWTKLTDVPAPATDQEIEVPDATATGSTQRVYRLVTPQQ